MPSTELLLLFLTTTFVVVLSPGPAAIAVSSESASRGMPRAFLVIAGVAFANTVYFVLSATGISALITGSSTLFNIIKWVGVGYLLYLGLSAIFSKAGAFRVGPPTGGKGPAHRAFMRGFILEMANPKALLYFAALLPQFIDPATPVLQQFVVFGLLTLVIDFSVYGSYAVLGALTARSGIKPSVVRWINRTAGGMLIFAGLKMSTIQS